MMFADGFFFGLGFGVAGVLIYGAALVVVGAIVAVLKYLEDR